MLFPNTILLYFQKTAALKASSFYVNTKGSFTAGPSCLISEQCDWRTEITESSSYFFGCTKQEREDSLEGSCKSDRRGVCFKFISV